MATLTIVPILQIALLLGAGDSANPDYKEAHRESVATGKPLLVLVTAKWCAGCVAVERNVLPELQRKGDLDDFLVARVDMAKEKKLAKQLTDAKRIPQLILFKKADSGWTKWELSGVPTVESVTEFLKSGDTAEVALLPDPGAR